MYVSFGIGPFRVGQRIGGRRRRKPARRSSVQRDPRVMAGTTWPEVKAALTAAGVSDREFLSWSLPARTAWIDGHVERG